MLTVMCAMHLSSNCTANDSYSRSTYSERDITATSEPVIIKAHSVSEAK